MNPIRDPYLRAAAERGVELPDDKPDYRGYSTFSDPLAPDGPNESCIHPNLFATGPVDGSTEHCWTCDEDIPRHEL